MTVANKQAVTTQDRIGTRPTHELVYQNLRERILFGEMAPGQPVTIQGLVASLGAGMTPVREAIRRLISEGALVFLGNRRIIVPDLTAEQLEELIFLRKSIECELSRRASQIIKPMDLNRLERFDADLDAAILAGDVHGYLVMNYRFHEAIYACAAAPILQEAATRLWLRFGPSLRVVCGRFGTQNLPDRHKELLEAFRARDAGLAQTAMAQDIEQGMEQITAYLSEKR
ncbi:MAG: GntR family transcriptional regulator [Arenibacterium sp.]